MRAKLAELFSKPQPWTGSTEDNATYEIGGFKLTDKEAKLISQGAKAIAAA